MGACLSCLGLSRDRSSDAERSRLLYHDDPYNQSGHGYGAYAGNGTHGMPAQNVMSPEDVMREQEALDNITRWASDQVVEIFPHQQKNAAASSANASEIADAGVSSSMHQDILLSMIPGDKSKKSIRVYPASRPTSGASINSIRSKASDTRLNGSSRSKDSSVFVKLNVDLT